MPKFRSRRSTQRSTMEDVSRMAAVSPSTVSLYLRNPDAVSAKLGRRIETAVAQLRYVPNRLAGSLAAARTKVVGVVVPSVVNAFFAATVSALQARLQANNYQLLLGVSEYGEETEEALVRTFLSWSPSGMILTGLKHSRQTRALLSNADVPVVEMWELGSNPLDMLVGFSHPDVGRTQTRHLIESGRRNIAFIGARMLQDRRAAQRAAGYREAIDSYPGLDSPHVIDVDGPASTTAAGVAFARLMEELPKTDGVVFSNDILALGALFEAQRRRIRVPDQVAIIGFGDLDFGRGSVPRLSTVRPSGTRIGETAADMLFARISGASGVAEIADLGFELLRRDSTSMPQADRRAGGTRQG